MPLGVPSLTLWQMAAREGRAGEHVRARFTVFEMPMCRAMARVGRIALHKELLARRTYRCDPVSIRTPPEGRHCRSSTRTAIS